MKRDEYWDTLKFFLIVLVVYGHVIMPEYQKNSHVNMAIFNFIYMFHMPLFMFISGRFSHMSDKKKYGISILRLLESYLVFQFIYACISFRDKDFNINEFWTPIFHMWYILSIIWYRLVIRLSPPQWLEKKRVCLFISLCISVMSGFVPIGDELSVQRTLAFSVFFMLGYYSIDYNIKSKLQSINITFAIVFLVLLFWGLYLYTDKSLSVMHHCNTPYYAKPLINRFIFRNLFIVLSIACSIMTLRIARSIPRFATWGRSTMVVYLYHFVLVDLLYIFIHKGVMPNYYFLHPLYALFIVGVLIWFSQYKIANIIINPTKIIIKCSSEAKKTND